MATNKVGGEIDAFCTRCKLTLAHTILAMVGTKPARVRCNTCGGDHAYRSAPGAKTPAKPRSSTPRASAAAKVVIGWDERLAGKDVAAAKKYSPRETFVPEELVNHPTFGIGIVTAVRHDKVDVAFKADLKTLIHGRGETPFAKPVFEAPKGRVNGPADKLPTAANDAGPEAAPPMADDDSLEAEESAEG
jgi:hypothetical protein